MERSQICIQDWHTLYVIGQDRCPSPGDSFRGREVLLFRNENEAQHRYRCLIRPGALLEVNSDRMEIFWKPCCSRNPCCHCSVPSQYLSSVENQPQDRLPVHHPPR